jgi:uncharacterized coiled-coil protein SlyX
VGHSVSDGIDLQRLSFQFEMVEKRLDRVEHQLQEQYGTLRELQGRINSDSTVKQLQDRISEIQSIDMEQQIAIGQIQGAIASAKETISQITVQITRLLQQQRQQDRDNNVTINVQGGQGGQSHVIGDDAHIDTMQTGSEAKIIQ